MWNEIVISGFADEIDSNLVKQITVLKKLDMKHIEMRGVNGKNLVDYSLAEAKEIKYQLDAEGISLSSVGSPIGKISITDDFLPHLEQYKHTVELAHLMETPYIRMFSFYMPKEAEYEGFRSKVMEQMGEFVDYAKVNNVTLLHENEKGIYGDNAAHCAELMNAFYGDHFKAVFDFANFVQCRQDTLAAYELLKPYIAYIHVKDAVWDSGKVVPAGMGDGHVEEILRNLKADGYQGYLSLEPHLGDFTGFSELEQAEEKRKQLSGEEAFTLAYHSLVNILEKL